MTQREKVLAILTIGTIVLVLGVFGFQRILNGFDQKQKQIDSLAKEISKKEDTIFQGLIASKKLSGLVSRSLPKRTDLAKREYQDWLFGVANSIGFSAPNVTPEQDFPANKVYRAQKFTFKGNGNILQLVKLLYTIYEKDYLHRITRMVWNPGTKPYEIVVSLDIETLSLNDAAPAQPAPVTKSNRVTRGVDEYLTVISEHNIFSEANLPPELTRQANTDAILGDRLSYEASAKDPENMGIEYALSGDVPEGMRIDKTSGKLSWNPKALGSYEVLILASDAGIPSKKSEQKLVINVVEPKPVAPPATPKNFDIASQSAVTAFLASGKTSEVWIYCKTDSKVHYLKIGDQLKLGSVSGKVVAIGATYAEFETDGKRWTVGQDETLADAFRRGNVD